MGRGCANGLIGGWGGDWQKSQIFCQAENCSAPINGTRKCVPGQFTREKTDCQLYRKEKLRNKSATKLSEKKNTKLGIKNAVNWLIVKRQQETACDIAD